MWFDTDRNTPARPADSDPLIDYVFALLAGLLLGAVAFVAALTIGIRVPGLWG